MKQIFKSVLFWGPMGSHGPDKTKLLYEVKIHTRLLCVEYYQSTYIYERTQVAAQNNKVQIPLRI